MWGLWLVAETQHQQAAGQLADGKPQSHTKSDFFLQNNISKHMTFTQGLTGQTPAVHHTITRHTEGSIMCSRALPS